MVVGITLLDITATSANTVRHGKGAGPEGLSRCAP
jgi:hypothetical protein